MNPAPDNTPWLKCRQSNPAQKLTLFCFPYAGGSAVIYHRWHDLLPASIRVCPVQLPGRAERLREAPMTDINEVVDHVEAAIGPYYDQPIALFGHSMGAFLTFELGRRLMANPDVDLVHLFVSGLNSPDHAYAGPFLSKVSDEEFKEAMRDYNGTPQEILEHEQFFKLLLPALRGDFALIENYEYKPEPIMDCPLTVLGAHDDPRTTIERLESWSALTSGRMDLHLLEGDHFFINTAHAKLINIIVDALVTYV